MFSALSVCFFLSASPLFCSVHDPPHLHGWLKLLNAQINPFPRQELVRHGGRSRILDISVMRFFFFSHTTERNVTDNQSTTEASRAASHAVRVNMKKCKCNMESSCCWCHLAPFGSAGLCGSVFSGFWKSLTCLLVLSFFFSFFFSCCWGPGGWVRRFPLLKSVTTQSSLDARHIFSPAITHARMNQ